MGIRAGYHPPASPASGTLAQSQTGSRPESGLSGNYLHSKQPPICTSGRVFRGFVKAFSSAISSLFALLGLCCWGSCKQPIRQVESLSEVAARLPGRSFHRGRNFTKTTGAWPKTPAEETTPGCRLPSAHLLLSLSLAFSLLLKIFMEVECAASSSLLVYQTNPVY